MRQEHLEIGANDDVRSRIDGAFHPERRGHSGRLRNDRTMRARKKRELQEHPPIHRFINMYDKMSHP
jgi:hypothetical protein